MLTRLKIRLAILAACALITLAALAAWCRAASALPRFPNTTRGIHVQLVFDYGVPPTFRFHGIDSVWAASKPVPGHAAFYYIPFDRDLSHDYSPQWWKANHPDWIEYKCGGAWATEYGHPDAPLDIANPAVREWQWSHEVLPALQSGYQGIAFDNLNLSNNHDRCGHYDTSGHWISQFAGPGGLQQYQQVVLSWARYMRAKLHQAGRLMGINYSPSSQIPWSLNLTLMALPDLLFDEGGVTNWGESANIATYQKWQLIFRLAWQVQRWGVCFELNGEEPQATSAIPRSEREWIIANYLLLKQRCTFVDISGYRADADASQDGMPSGTLEQDYGQWVNFPEYRLPIGRPLGAPVARGGLWKRRYTGGLVLVNPGYTPHGYRTRKPLYALGTFRRARYFALPAQSAVILLRRPAG